MVANIFKSKHVDKAMDMVDDSTLTMQERADKSVELQERLGITASSKTRRFVTWFMLIYVSTWFLSMALIHALISPDMASQMFEWIKEYCSNAIIITIVSFFFGGYYLNKIVSPRVKEVIEKKKQKREHEEQKFKDKITRKELRTERKRRRIQRH